MNIRNVVEQYKRGHDKEQIPSNKENIKELNKRIKKIFLTGENNDNTQREK